MTNVEGVVDEVVVGEGDALGVARCTGGELDTQRVTSTFSNQFNVHDAL